MSLTMSKDLSVNKVSIDYGVVLGSETIACDLVFTVTSVLISGTQATASVDNTVNGTQSLASKQYSFTYDSTAGDIVKQAEKYLLTLAEFKGATQD